MRRAGTDESFVRVRDYLVAAIEKNEVGIDGRLPTERELAEKFGVGRATARRALAQLETDGQIHRKVGRGTFVNPKPAAVDRATVTLGSCSPLEYIEVRLRFEPGLAWMIVANATRDDLENVREHLMNAGKATSVEAFEKADAKFHLALANASHNALAIEIYGMIHAIRRREHALWGNMHGHGKIHDQRQVFQQEHEAIVEALINRDGAAAEKAWQHHLNGTRRRMLNI